MSTPAKSAAPKKASIEDRMAEAAEARNSQVQHLAAMITGLTVLVATKTDTPEVAVDIDESAKIVDAFLIMSEEFDWQPDPRVTASINFAVTVGAVIGSHVMAYRMRKSEEAEDQPEQPK